MPGVVLKFIWTNFLPSSAKLCAFLSLAGILFMFMFVYLWPKVIGQMNPQTCYCIWLSIFGWQFKAIFGDH